MIGSMKFNKPNINYQGTLTLKPLTADTGFVGIMDQSIRDKNDCKQSRFYLKVVWGMGVLHNNTNKTKKRKSKSNNRTKIELCQTHSA